MSEITLQDIFDASWEHFILRDEPPAVVCHVLNTLCRLDDAQKQVRAATIELKGG